MTAAAQTSSSSLAGTVADSSNSVIPGATVTVTNETSGETRQAKTAATGDFVFTAMTPGVYTVKVEASGLRTLESKNNVLVSSSRLALGTLQLQVGAVNQSVEVTAQGAQVQTDSAEHSELIDSKEMQN
ncbi:MAG TPA: carboxypeptidase-like regulatory domain-containing protein, partial [Bryobacteraceae bacterium]|nr:carboxypeptidase-like regulatory domain-containing protein [Bryobacteraceae bacterium]